MGNPLTSNNHNPIFFHKIKHGDSPNLVMNKPYFWKILDFLSLYADTNQPELQLYL
jgi:hypothetical protein